MTPLVLSKRFVKQLGKVCEQLPPAGHTLSHTHPMNWHSVSYGVPSSLLYAWPTNAPQKLCLRSNFTITVNSMQPNSSSHKQCQSELSQYWLNVCDRPIQLQYTDPRTNTEHTIQWEPYSSFILSTPHPHSVSNPHSEQITWISIHTGMTWNETAKHYQHQW